jgi:hypothetical protein
MNRPPVPAFVTARIVEGGLPIYLDISELPDISSA